MDDFLNTLSAKHWLEFWCSTYDLEENEYESNICYYFTSTNAIWDGEEFITNVPADLAEYIKSHYPTSRRFRKTCYRIGIAYELTRTIEIHFSRRAIIDKFLQNLNEQRFCALFYQKLLYICPVFNLIPHLLYI